MEDRTYTENDEWECIAENEFKNTADEHKNAAEEVINAAGREA